tara:strand:- start:17384 stop:18796 length:1413 start_codon:yes stop_codon:yes gene_type:complete
MKRHIRIVLIFLSPFCVSAQSSIFDSNLVGKSPNIFSSSFLNSLDTNNSIQVGSRYLALNSFSSTDNNSSFYMFGLSLNANIREKFSVIALYDYLEGDYSSQIQQYQDSLGVYYPGFGSDKNRLQFNFRYLANNFIVLDIGHGKQFVGSGYHSLLLSDVGSSYPYFKVSTSFGPVKYYNLYSTFINPDMLDFGRKKHAAIHYLDFAITPNIHLGVFESILWQSKSNEINRGYELAYLNPVIFYRPVEFSKKSDKGNALMGANLNVEFHNFNLYGQLMLDDLNISRQRDRDSNYESGFFQNKYAFQIGLKRQVNGFSYVIEYNQVQPYTYGHRTILQNYSHMNQALAHPLGANFKELINILNISKGRLNYKMKVMWAHVGLDSLNTHYGQNIFESDYEASTGGQTSYGNFNGQGVLTKILSFQPEVSFKLKHFDVFASVYYKKLSSDLIDQNLIYFSIGFRNFPFSVFPNY